MFVYDTLAVNLSSVVDTSCLRSVQSTFGWWLQSMDCKLWRNGEFN